MTDRELMQQALDALTQANQCIFTSAKLPFPPALNATSKAAEALRARLAQPEQEPIATLFGSLPVYDVPPAKPVAWVENLENARPHCVTDLKYCSVAQHERGEHLKYIPLYPAPPQREWQGLTDEQVKQIEMSASSILSAIYLAEAQLRGKNAL